MSKASPHFVCNNCGYESLKWSGCCNGCGEWNTFAETSPNNEHNFSKKRHIVNTSRFSEITTVEYLKTGIEEFDRVLGKGAVKGEVIVIGGAPGIGKSTLLLSISEGFLKNNQKVLYFSAEESLNQVFQRLRRVVNDFQMVKDGLEFVNSSNTDDAVSLIYSGKYNVVIVDSVQTISSQEVSGIAGNINQVRESAFRLTQAAKEKDIFVVLVSHVTKDGILAGPMVLSHIVDGVFMLETDRRGNFRILRALKNRYGSIDEVGVFQMSKNGMVPINDISQILIKNGEYKLPGTARGILIEGVRPMMVEIESLVVRSGYSNPKRGANGIRLTRIQMLVAVLSKSLKLDLSEQDIYVSIAGGFKTDDPALDLPICMSIISSIYNFVLPQDSVFIGEVSLTGEIRTTFKHDLRYGEAKNLGFKKIFDSTSLKYKTILDIVRSLNLDRK